MNIKIAFGIIAGILTLIGYYPYFKDIFKKKTTPHLYTWLIWGITQGTATIAALYGGANFGALSLSIGTILVAIIFILCFKYGTRDITKSDTVTLIIALFAIAVWWILHNALLSVIIVATIDAIGYIPTFRKSFRDPFSETLWFWATMTIVNILSFIAIENYNFLTVIYPIILVTGNFAVWIICFVRRKTIS